MSRLISVHTLTVLLTAATLVTATAQAQTTWYVDDDAPNDPGPGDPSLSDPNEDGSPEHPFDAIQEGIDAAIDGDTVLVLDGTYTGLGNKSLDFHGKAITLRSENGPDTCIIDCEGSGRGFRFRSGETNASMLAGFAITNANAHDGGGVYCHQSSPTITNCTIAGNVAGNEGAGIYCSNSDPTISNCMIAQNETTWWGGGVFCYFSNPTIDNCTMTQNSSGMG